MKRLRILLSLVSSVALGCGDDGGTDGSLDAGPTADGGGLDAGPVGEDLGEPPLGCTDVTLDTSFVVGPGLSETTIHPSVVFDGEALWLTVTTVEEGTSGFDIYLVRMGCDGRQGEPVLVSETEGLSDIDADLALGSEGVLVAWQADGGEGTIATWVRLHDDATGEPLEDPAPIQTTREGEPLEGTVWFPVLVPAPDGFRLIGSRGVESASAFQAYVQPLGPRGAITEPTIEPWPEPMVAQNGVVGAWVGGADGGLTLAFSREPAEGVPEVVVQPEGADPTPVPTGAIEETGPSIVHADGVTWVALSAGGGAARSIALVDVDGGTTTTFDRVGTTDTAPALAAGEPGALGVAWLRNLSGFRNDLFLRAVDVSGDEPVAGDEVEIPTVGDVFAYAVDLVHIREDIYFVTWVEGTMSPMLQVRGRFLRL